MKPAALAAHLGERTGWVVWGYRDAVLAAAAARGLVLAVDHSMGPAQIGLRLPGPEPVTATWRPDTGWYLALRPDPSSVEPASLIYRCGPGADPLALVPAPEEVTDWLVATAAGERGGSAAPPQDVELGPPALARLLAFEPAAVPLFVR